MIADLLQRVRREVSGIPGELYEELGNAAFNLGWHPIESAPKDGSRILVIMDGKVKIASWETQNYNMKPRPYWKTEGQILQSIDRSNQPVKWMPLPKES